MSVEILTDRCEGHGICESMAPEVFRLDDDGFVQLVPGGDQDSETAVAAANSCPVAALRTTS